MTSDIKQHLQSEWGGREEQGTEGTGRPSTHTSSSASAEVSKDERSQKQGGMGLSQAASREASSIGEQASAAKAAMHKGGSDLGSIARDKAAKEAEKGKDAVSSGLEDFAAAIRKASDELGSRDQSMASGLVREVASGLEEATGAIKGKSLQELTQSVAGFARRQPTAFLVGAALVGVALGRFARASGSSHHDPADLRDDMDLDAGWESETMYETADRPGSDDLSARVPLTPSGATTLQPDPLEGSRASSFPTDRKIPPLTPRGTTTPGEFDNVR